MDHSAMLVKAGSRLIMNVHYTTNGKPTTDVSRGALEILPEKPQNLVYMVHEPGLAPDPSVVIPAGDASFPGEEQITFTRDAKLAWLQPHMHLRGKDWKYTVTYPDGRQEMLLNVPHFDFYWQTIYYPDSPVDFPAGTKLDILGHWDNSANNRENPDPTQPAKIGQQVWEEMFNAQVYVSIPANVSPDSIVVKSVKFPSKGDAKATAQN
jgi:hypothetical protein